MDLTSLFPMCMHPSKTVRFHSPDGVTPHRSVSSPLPECPLDVPFLHSVAGDPPKPDIAARPDEAREARMWDPSVDKPSSSRRCSVDSVRLGDRVAAVWPNPFLPWVSGSPSRPFLMPALHSEEKKTDRNRLLDCATVTRSMKSRFRRLVQLAVASEPRPTLGENPKSPSNPPLKSPSETMSTRTPLSLASTASCRSRDTHSAEPGSFHTRSHACFASPAVGVSLDSDP